MVCKAPYNFVPINDAVFFPEWAEHISHDIPFKDGESGVIKLSITAKNPIFVKNGTPDKSDHSFSCYNGQYFIPGTSIKGMIRNVLETMSFGKMQAVDDRRFSWRDLTPSADYTKDFTDGIKARPNVRSGFIKKTANGWILTPCEYARIEQCELDDDFGVSDKLLSAADKYKFWEENKLEKLVQSFSITTSPSTEVFEKQCGSHYRARLDSFGNKEGQLVFTGQIGPRFKGGEGKHGKGKKHLEFVFFDREESEYQISSTMQRDFELNHSEERGKERHSNALSPNAEWGYWDNKMKNGEEMPVFWLPKREQRHKVVSSFGLAMLYRLPLEQSVHEQIRCSSADHVKHLKEGRVIDDLFKADLPESIFGHISGKDKLKGRVQFGHAMLSGTPEILPTASEVLGSPKATFYPNYLQKETYSSPNKIKGRKRYPIQNNITKSVNETGNKNIETQFTPLNAGCKFEFKIHFHNLKKVEVGALLSALTFHQTPSCFHSIGMAKSLGYGKISLNIEEASLTLSQEEYLKHFELEMNKFYYIKRNKTADANYWLDSIKELIAMASEQNGDVNKLLSYMSLEEHIGVKNSKTRLPYYSEIKGHNAKNITSFCSDSDLKDLFKDCNKEKEAQKIKSADLDARKTSSNNLATTSRKTHYKASRKLTEIVGILTSKKLNADTEFSNLEIALTKDLSTIEEYLTSIKATLDTDSMSVSLQEKEVIVKKAELMLQQTVTLLNSVEKNLVNLETKGKSLLNVALIGDGLDLTESTQIANVVAALKKYTEATGEPLTEAEKSDVIGKLIKLHKSASKNDLKKWDPKKKGKDYFKSLKKDLGDEKVAKLIADLGL